MILGGGMVPILFRNMSSWVASPARHPSHLSPTPSWHNPSQPSLQERQPLTHFSSPLHEVHGSSPTPLGITLPRSTMRHWTSNFIITLATCHLFCHLLIHVLYLINIHKHVVNEIHIQNNWELCHIICLYKHNVHPLVKTELNWWCRLSWFASAVTRGAELAWAGQ